MGSRSDTWRWRVSWVTAVCASPSRMWMITRCGAAATIPESSYWGVMTTTARGLFATTRCFPRKKDRAHVVSRQLPAGPHARLGALHEGPSCADSPFHEARVAAPARRRRVGQRHPPRSGYSSACMRSVVSALFLVFDSGFAFVCEEQSRFYQILRTRTRRPPFSK